MTNIFEYGYFRILRWCMHDYNENDTHVIHLYNSKPMPPKQSWRMPLSSSSSYSSCHDYIMLLSVSIFDFASWYDNQSSVTLLQKRFYTLSEVRQSRVAPWCGKGKELKRCMTNWWFACIWLRATNRHKHSFWHLL